MIVQSGGSLLRSKLHLVSFTCFKNTTRPRLLHDKMRLIQFTADGTRQRLGVELQNGGDVVDLSASNEPFPNDMLGFVKDSEKYLGLAKKVITSGQHLVKRDQIKLLPPITNPEKVLCVGMNYVDHCTEQNVPVPTEPVIFNKFASSIVGPNDDVIYPDVTEELDWEVELVIVVGKTCKDVKVADAMDCVFGYTVAHDVSARDWQMTKNGKQWLLGKAMDSFCPLGPAIVTKADISDPHNLGIRCRVNQKIMQESNTNQLVFKTESLIAFITRFMTLKPGDLILTGTPPGVGVFRKPLPIFLKRGDVVECEIDEIGTITNKIV